MSNTVIIILSLLNTLSLIATTFGMIQFFVNSKKILKTIILLPLLIAEILSLSILSLLANGIKLSYLSEIPDLTFYIYIPIILFLNVAVLLYLFIKYNKNISLISIKESVDNIPVGLCYYYENGATALVNKLMDKLSSELTGGMIANGKTFSDSVCGKTLKVKDKYYSFKEDIIDVGGVKIHQLYATDTTSLRELYNDLEKDNKQLKEMNKLLHSYNKNVESLTRDEEILRAKTNIHDEMGRMLLTTKIALESHKGDYSDIIDKWDKTISIFKSGGKSHNWNEVEKQLIAIGKSLNLNIKINNSIGENPLFIDAVKECITNAVRHGKAKNLVVNSAENYIEIINDGIVPKTITEGGGLQNLRERTENLGGTMSVNTSDYFTLIIDFRQNLTQMGRDKT